MTGGRSLSLSTFAPCCNLKACGSSAKTPAEHEFLLRLAGARRMLALAKRIGEIRRIARIAHRDCNSRFVALRHAVKLAHLVRIKPGHRMHEQAHRHRLNDHL